MWGMMTPPGRTCEGHTEIRDQTAVVMVQVRVLVSACIVIYAHTCSLTLGCVSADEIQHSDAVVLSDIMSGNNCCISDRC